MIHTYSLFGHGQMLADRQRMEAYRQALLQTVKPGSVVLDIGTGTGIMAMLACQYGARRVYAIEPGDVIQAARELAAVNGYADRIKFIQGLSTEVILPEAADVIVSDLHGVLPLFQQLIPATVDARRRFLAPGGKLIPQSDTLWAAVLESPEQYGKIIGPWRGEVYGLDLSPAREMVANTFASVAVIEKEQLLGAPQCWATIDFFTIENPNVAGEITWKASRPGTGHGLALWFDCTVAPGIGFSNAPGEPEHVYGRNFLPWMEPVNLNQNETVAVSLRADLVGGDYLWRWDTRIYDSEGQLKANFQQSTFYGTLLPTARLQQLAADHVPELNGECRIDRFILGLMDGDHSLADITQQVTRQFPQRFANEKEALTRAGELSLRYGRPLDNKYFRDT
jgi:protein arginine N-methyltransferase 1